MGSLYAFTIIGVRVSQSIFNVEVKVRGCDHPETSTKFCVECGNPMFNFYTESTFDDLTKSIENLPASLGFGIVQYNAANNIYVGKVLSPGVNKVDAFSEIPDFNDIKDRLERLNLQTSNFGIWTVFRRS